MDFGVFGTHTPCQIGLIVADVEKAKKEWATLLGMEVPPTVDAGEYEITKTIYKGQPAPEAGCNMAFFELGNIQLELIMPNAAQSTWRDHLEQKGSGIHHIAFRVEDIFATMEALKGELELTQWGYYGDGSGAYAYYDAMDRLGCYLELLCDFKK